MVFEKQLAVAVKAARKAGAVALNKFNTKYGKRPKGVNDIVTEVDFESQALIEKILAKAFPPYSFLGEESVSKHRAERGFQWIVDPLDGTANYAMRLPWYAVSVALAKDGQPVAGVIYKPADDELFAAALGKGAFLNGKRVRVSRAPLEELALGFSVSHKRERTRRIAKHLPFLHPFASRMRSLGTMSVESCNVAAGTYGAYYNLYSSPWDFGAAKVIVEEAGGVTSDVQGRPWTLSSESVLAANSRRTQKIIVDAIAKAEGRIK